MSREEAIAELRHCSGTQFDPKVVEKFIEIVVRDKSEVAPTVDAVTR
jgi:HD-GYP domain-containing protein (c-di-GMP phosphodiesterase class II)